MRLFMSAALSLTLISPSPSISGLLACLIVTFVCLFIFLSVSPVLLQKYFSSTSQTWSCLASLSRQWPSLHSPFLTFTFSHFPTFPLSLFLAFPLSLFHTFSPGGERCTTSPTWLCPASSFPPWPSLGSLFPRTLEKSWGLVCKQKTNNQTNQNKQGGWLIIWLASTTNKQTNTQKEKQQKQKTNKPKNDFGEKLWDGYSHSEVIGKNYITNQWCWIPTND